MKYNLFFYYCDQKPLNDYFNIPLKCYKNKLYPLMISGRKNIETVKHIYDEVM